MPDGLLAWYSQHARDTGRPVNAVLVEALEAFRADRSAATTAAPPRRKGATASRRQHPAAPDGGHAACKHPRVIKGLCSVCHAGGL
jgi:hypothetical protein